MKERKYDHGRYAVNITFTSNEYVAETDAKGNPLPFTLESEDAGNVRVWPEDGDAFVDIYILAGRTPDKIIKVSDEGGGITTGLTAWYPYKPATTTINTTE